MTLVKYKTLKYVVVMTIGMVMASIPAIFLTSSSINFFDEPYQIINSMEWRTSIYSPLSSWMGNIFGNCVQWKYLAFRYLSLCLNFISIYAGALYALLASRKKRSIIIWSIIVTLLGLSFKGLTGYYGWDNWTVCFLSLYIILFISLNKRFNWFKLILLGFLCSVISLLRIPNISLFICSVIIFSLMNKFHGRKVIMIISFSAIFIFSLWGLLTLLYGNICTFFDLFFTYKIGDHSISQICRPILSRFILALFYAVGFYLSYKWLKSKQRLFTKRIIYCILVLLFTISLLYSRGESFGMGPLFCFGMSLFSLFLLFRYNKQNKSHGMNDQLIILFLIPFVSAIGSNAGCSKTLIWPIFPLIIGLFGNHFKGTLKNLYICWAVAYGIYSIIGITQYNLMDEKISLLTYKFNDKESVLYGMRTTPERGEMINNIYEDMKPYLKKGYIPIVLKQGNDYIYEYIMKAPNKYQRHNFSNWFAFWEEDYINSVQKEINNLNQPVVVLYRQWKDPDNLTPMLVMLSENTICEVDKPGYSIWVKD